MNDNARADLGKLILRLALGILVLLHGIGKIKGGMDGITGLVGNGVRLNFLPMISDRS